MESISLRLRAAPGAGPAHRIGIQHPATHVHLERYICTAGGGIARVREGQPHGARALRSLTARRG
eukprot:6111979-Prymnesium_polylepis.1